MKCVASTPTAPERLGGPVSLALVFYASKECVDPFTSSSFLSAASLLCKDGGVPGAAHSALLGQGVLQALNGMGGDLGLLPDVALKTLISDGVFPAKGRWGRGEPEAQPSVALAHLHCLRISFLAETGLAQW